MRSSWLAIIIALILFTVPFFWLKPGEINLGGDSSRLFLYDPQSFLFVNTLYGIIPSDIGGESVSYYALPYMSILVLFKSIFQSPTILIAISNGLTLCLGFLCVFLIIKEFLHQTYPKSNKGLVTFISCLTGIFYVLCPFMLSGWDRTLLNHYQIFINPLIFFLLLKFFITDNFRYLLSIILVTFVFSFSFSFIGAPSFFAFYPVSVVFLLVYTRLILKKKIPVKKLFGAFLLFVAVQSFHLLPHIANIFNQDSSFNQNIFSENKILSRGRDYFIATAPSIKPSVNFFALLQGSGWTVSNFLFVIFPLLLVLGFIFNKGKFYLITALFFFFTFFFATANITNIGLFIYKELFLLPGFAMFRSFYGQWGYVFVFFYSLMVAQALFFVSQKIKRQYFYLLSLALFIIVVINAWPLITGQLLHHLHPQSKKIDVVFKMDPVYEQSLEYVSRLPVDGKILTLPLSGFGYQVLSGEQYGAYVGPPLFSYLGGKNDFSSYDRLVPFNEKIGELVYEKNYTSLKPLLSILNIKYIYHNSDPLIYDKTFPAYPYESVRDFFPKTQKEYETFINKLPVTKTKQFGNYFTIYTIDDNVYFPHIYVPENIVQTNEAVSAILSQQNTSVPFGVVESEKDFPVISERTIIADQINSLSSLQDNYHLHRHEPFISRSIDDPLYFLTIAREDFELWRIKDNPRAYVDFSLLYLSKRIYELNQYGDDTAVGGKKSNNKLTWEAVLSRYGEQADSLIKYINQNKDENKNIEKIKINEQLLKHELKIRTVIRGSRKTLDEKRYLFSLVDSLYSKLYKNLELAIYDSKTSRYTLPLHKRGGTYEVFVSKEDVQNNTSQMQISIDGKLLHPVEGNAEDAAIKFDDVVLDNRETVPFTLQFIPQNIAGTGGWVNSGQAQQNIESTKLNIKNILHDNSSGMQQKLEGIKPNTQYLITFEYKVKDKTLFSFVDKRQMEDTGNNMTTNRIFTKLLRSKDWQTHQSLLTTDIFTKEAFIQFENDDDVENNEIDIRNIEVTPVQSPTIYFKKVNQNKDESNVVPNITFTKINPTKYSVHIRDAKMPYVIVLSEAFNTKWKVINPYENESGFGAQLSKVFSTIANPIAGMISIRENKTESITNTYYSGKVTEKAPENIFLDSKTFDTWGKKELSESSHFVANGYANGWYIEPQDVKGQNEYDLIIEFSTQRMFYLGLLISSCALILCVLLFIIFRYKK